MQSETATAKNHQAIVHLQEQPAVTTPQQHNDTPQQREVRITLQPEAHTVQQLAVHQVHRQRNTTATIMILTTMMMPKSFITTIPMTFTTTRTQKTTLMSIMIK